PVGGCEIYLRQLAAVTRRTPRIPGVIREVEVPPCREAERAAESQRDACLRLPLDHAALVLDHAAAIVLARKNEAQIDLGPRVGIRDAARDEDRHPHERTSRSADVQGSHPLPSAPAEAASPRSPGTRRVTRSPASPLILLGRVSTFATDPAANGE